MMLRSCVVKASLALACLGLVACATPAQHAQPEIAHHHHNADASSKLVSDEADDTLRVMTLNIAHARGTGFSQMFQDTPTARANLDSIALLLKHEAPDIASLQEADRQSVWNGNFDHVSFLAENGAFSQSLSGTHVYGMGLDYGTALVAKLDLSSPHSVTFDPVDPAGPKGFVVSAIKWPGRECVEVDVVSAHLDFASAQTRREQVAEIVSLLQHRNRPVVLMGDFNADWRRTNSAVRVLADELSLHAYEPHTDSLMTFPKHQRRLDWILVSKDIHFQSYRVVDTVVSDHLGVISDLSIDRSCG